MNDNGHAEQAHQRGLQFRKDNKPADAVDAFREAVRLRPGWADAHNNLGLSLRAVGSLDDALTAFRAALRAKCDHPEARNNLGVTLSDQGLLNEAVATYRQVLKLRPNAADTHNNLGVVLAQQGKRAEAIASYRRAIELRPDYAEAHNNLGNSLRHEGKLEEAEAELRTALRLKPHYAEAYNNLAIILVKQERVDEAIALYHEALRLKPDYRDAHKNLGLALLGKGEYAAGWPEYAYRWGTKEMPARSFEAPAWDGGPLEGKTILLYAEQGLGDTIQFIGFAAAVAERGARVMVECQKALIPLLSRCAGIERLVAQGAVLPPFDMQTPLMSVPGLLAVGHVSNVPAQPGELCNQPAVNGHVGNVPHGGTPYLTAEPDRIRRWATELAPFTGFKIGVSWQGSRSYQEDQFRSIPLAKFEPIARVAGTRLFSLQKGYGSEQIGRLRGWRVHDFGQKLDAAGAFLDTAALMMHLDLVITSDTAIAHLAGALGVKVWLALPTAPDWRWLQEREDSPWYPTMRLFRQQKRGDWDGVFARMARELEALPALENASHYAERGLALLKESKPADAAALLGRAIELEPRNAIFRNNHAVALDQDGKKAEALAGFQEAVRLSGDYADARHNLGNMLRRAGRLVEAEEQYRKTLPLLPDSADLHNHLGIALLGQAKHKEAEACFRRALSLKPDHAEAHNNLGVLFEQLGRLDESIAAYAESRRLKPDAVDTHRNLALGWLMRGDYARGWAEYEWRWHGKPQRFTQPRWDGRALDGETVLLHAEQGLGDTIQFARYAELVQARGGTVVVECPAALEKLLARCPGIDRVVPQGTPLPEFAYHVPFLSLPGVFQTTRETVPARVPYLSAEPERVERWGREIVGPVCNRPERNGHTRHDGSIRRVARPESAKGVHVADPRPSRTQGVPPNTNGAATKRHVGNVPHMTIAIAWQGSQRYQGDAHRSIRLREFAPLAKVPGVRLVSLQKGFGSEQLAEVPEWNVVDFGVRLDADGAFLDTAAILMHVDLLVTSDTAVAHLAGALGVETWLALSMAADWRWLRDRDDSPWYPSVRIFRQQQWGDWETVFARMADELQARGGGTAGSLQADLAPGELLDKITILQIKRSRVADEQKQRNIRIELGSLLTARAPSVKPTAELERLTADLQEVNAKLWDVEDALRRHEQREDFGAAFVELARSVYQTNDRRAALKRAINERLQSQVLEEKSYVSYDGNQELRNREASVAVE